MEKITQLEKDKSYLVESKSGISKITVLEITNTSVKVKYENGYIAWMRKSEFIFEQTFPVLDNLIIEKID